MQREPVALWMAVVTPLIQLLSSFLFPLTDEQQSLLNAAAAAILGLVAAWQVSTDKALPMLAGVVQAIIAVGIGFGMELDPTAQSAILALVAAAVSFFVRTQVDAPAPRPQPVR